MLILAGVSINAIVGENGILSRATSATETHKKASLLEELNMQLAGYNMNTFTDKEVGIQTILKELLENGYIDGVLNSSGDYVQNETEALPVPRFDENNNYMDEVGYGVQKDGYSISIFTGNDGIYMAEYGEISFSSGGSVQGGTVLVTEESFNNATDTNEDEKGKYVIDKDSNLIFIDKIDGELSIYVKSGTHSKINVLKDMTLTNTGMARSAIDIEAGGILDLYVANGVTLNVNSGFGESGEVSGELGKRAEGGPGGYAGIHVPENAEFNLYGNGTIIAVGGNAGNGGECVSGNVGGGGGGGAGAGIGGNGGKGGSANTTILGQLGVKVGDNPLNNTNSGFDGENGENAGQIGIFDKAIVYAYGGDGGAGGTDNSTSAGGGGGGYPAAGIGGGGAGGRWWKSCRRCWRIFWWWCRKKCFKRRKWIRWRL